MTVMPTIISRVEATARLAVSLGMCPSAEGPVGVTLPLVAQSLRRAAHILAPCPRHELERAVRLSLTPVASEDSDIITLVEEGLDGLLAYGDILEIKTESAEPWATHPLVLRPAPPAFVLRKNGNAILLGVAGDDITPLSLTDRERVVAHGVLRILVQRDGESIGSLLTELGLIELSERLWLRLPRVEPASEHLAYWARRLTAQPLIFEMSGLQVIDPRRPPNFYRGRWVDAAGCLDGLHVGRREQRYGAALWCIVEIEDGQPKRFLDLTAGAYHERPCDLGWRIQMAIDALGTTPQCVRPRVNDDGVGFDFFSPLPGWAERKLTVVGQRTASHNSLLSYNVPIAERREILDFISNYLWISPVK